MTDSHMDWIVEDMCILKEMFSTDWSTGRKYPFYGVQWHPEVNRFQWNPHYSFPHSRNAVHVSSQLAQFLANEGNFVCLQVYLPACLSVSFPVCMFISLSACFSVCLSMCLSVCLFVSVSLCLSACLSVCLFLTILYYLYKLCLSVYLSASLPV